MKPLYWWMLTSRQWTPPRPINAYVIEHSKGLILFDAGQDRASVTDDTYFPGGLSGLIYDRVARFRICEQDTLTARLAGLGYTPADVGTVIVSHLHQDHIGGLRELKAADLLVSAAEWSQLSRAAPELRGFLRMHIQLPGLKWRHITMAARRRSIAGTLHRVAGCHGGRFARAAPYPRSHGGLDVAASPASDETAAASGRGSHLRG